MVPFLWIEYVWAEIASAAGSLPISGPKSTGAVKNLLTLLGVDARTGEQRWRTARPALALLGLRSTWSTPCVWKNDLRTEIVTSDYGGICSYGRDGQLLWVLKGATSNLIIPSPIAAHGMVYVTSGDVGDRDRPVYAIRPGAEGRGAVGEIPSEHPCVAWSQPQAGPYNTSPIVYGDYYYTLLDRGFLTCHNVPRANPSTRKRGSRKTPPSPHRLGPTTERSSV